MHSLRKVMIFNTDALRRLRNTLRCLRKEIYGLSQLQAVYIIPATLPLYLFPEDGRRSILSDFKKLASREGLK